MRYLIQSTDDDLDCYYVTLDENNYIVKHSPVDIDDLVLDDQNIKNILNTKPDLEDSYFQIEPSYRFNAWKL
jgi:hypothetical protein